MTGPDARRPSIVRALASVGVRIAALVAFGYLVLLNGFATVNFLTPQNTGRFVFGPWPQSAMLTIVAIGVSVIALYRVVRSRTIRSGFAWLAGGAIVTFLLTFLAVLSQLAPV